MKASKENYHRNNTLTAYRDLTAPPPSFENKLWLLPLNEIYKGKEIIVYISIPYNTYPKPSTNTALFSRFYTIKLQNHQTKYILITYGQL